MEKEADEPYKPDSVECAIRETKGAPRRSFF